MNAKFPMKINDNTKRGIEEQIYEQRKEVDYDTREFTIEHIVNKYTYKIDEDKNDIYVPDYQREFVWDDIRQSRFIESIILGLPIPYIFVAENKDGRLEIVDGSQRIRTLSAFLADELTLINLSKLSLINKKKYSDLDDTRQRKINNTPIRMVVLTEATSEEAKTEMFDRINKGSDLLKDMEQRKALIQGPFTDFIYKISATKEFIEAAPQNKFLEKRQEREELVLRFFALCDSYQTFPQHQGIAKYLDEFMKKANIEHSEEIEAEMSRTFNQVVQFVARNFKYKFSKSHNNQVSRPYFEAISIGLYLALKQNPGLKCSICDTEKWLRGSEFKRIMSGRYQTHSPARIRERIEYVRDQLLSK